MQVLLEEICAGSVFVRHKLQDAEQTLQGTVQLAYLAAADVFTPGADAVGLARGDFIKLLITGFQQADLHHAAVLLVANALDKAGLAQLVHQRGNVGLGNRQLAREIADRHRATAEHHENLHMRKRHVHFAHHMRDAEELLLQNRRGFMWNLRNEDFMADSRDWLTNGQISFSSGTSGNSEIQK